MEFEGVLLSTLLAASCPNEWENALAGQIGCVAGDDYTLVMAVLGFRSFEALRQAFTPVQLAGGALILLSVLADAALGARAGENGA